MAGHCPEGANMKIKQHNHTKHEHGDIALRWTAHTANLRTGFAQALDTLIGKPGDVMTFERTRAGIRIRRAGHTIDVDTHKLANAIGVIGKAEELGVLTEMHGPTVRAMFGHAVTRSTEPTPPRGADVLPAGALDAALARAQERLVRIQTLDALLDALLDELFDEAPT
jgi:hypothetical protein